MAPDQTPQLRFILNYAAKNPEPESPSTVWYPGESLRGHLELSNAKDVAIERITIYFEGQTSTTKAALLLANNPRRSFTNLDSGRAGT
jgi:hypothetical protein